MDQQNNKSYWKDKFEKFEIINDWMKHESSRKRLNVYRKVKINDILYYEVRFNNKHDITFICDIDDHDLLKNHTWRTCKRRDNNGYYAKTNIMKNNKSIIIRFHQIKNPEWKMTDHINRNGLDNRSINLHETTYELNMRNRSLHKNNTSGINGVSYHNSDKKWRVQWYKDKEYKIKYFKNKKEAVNYRKNIDDKLGITNGYDVNYI
jgi:hypothetical protein